MATFFLDEPVKRSSHAPLNRTYHASGHLLLSGHVRVVYEYPALARPKIRRRK